MILKEIAEFIKGEIMPLINRKAVMIEYEEMKVKILNQPTLYMRALIGFLYGTGCRVGELTQLRKKHVTEETITQDGVSKELVLIKLHTEKNKIQKERIIPIRKNGKEEWLASLMLTYKDSFKDSESLLFKSSRVTIWKEVTNALKEFNAYTHWLRHVRTTHLSTEFGFNDKRLQQFNGWSDPRASMRYSHLNYKDLVR